MTPAASAFAPAKVNLALHVTGRRGDGYHLLDSLVVFADVGDRLTFAPSDELSLTLEGPRTAGVPTDDRNLVLRAARLLSPDRGAAITLDKHLPNAAGLGGGSADAAAALRGLSDLWGVPLPGTDTVLSLGADVPVCLSGTPARMRGVGERLEPVPPLPTLWMVLVNPGIAVSTGAVFAALQTVDGAPMSPPDWTDYASFIGWLCAQRNDMEPPARGLAPEIGTALATLDARPGCALARMSGSGASCFGLFGAETAAREAAATIRADHRAWWVQAAQVM